MILYHYTDLNAAKKIATEGLTKGRIPLGERELANGKKTLCLSNEGYQWLTTLPNGIKSLKRSYRNIRLTIEIPDDDPNLLSPRKWKEKVRPYVIPGYWGTFSTPMNDHFWIYEGTIPSSWIKAVDAARFV